MQGRREWVKWEVRWLKMWINAWWPIDVANGLVFVFRNFVVLLGICSFVALVMEWRESATQELISILVSL